MGKLLSKVIFIKGSLIDVIMNTAMAVSLSVENAENGSLHILNTYAHGNYVVFACTYQFPSWHSWKSSFSSTFLLFFHLH